MASKKQFTEDVPAPSSEEETVREYLRAHPEFFQAHPDLLADISVPHPQTGAAVSLIERQVVALRDRQRALAEQLEGLLDNARENERLADRLHHAALLVAAATRLDSLLNELAGRLREDFELVDVAVRLHDAPLADAGAVSGASRDDPVYAGLVERVSHGRSVCDDRLPKRALKFLFGDEATAVGSVALLPVGHREPRGVIALGAADATRFRPDMGTVYVDRLGELVGVAVGRLLGDQDRA